MLQFTYRWYIEAEARGARKHNLMLDTKQKKVARQARNRVSLALSWGRERKKRETEDEV